MTARMTNEQASVVIVRSGGICERCGESAAHAIHHRRRGMGGSSVSWIHAPQNLAHLCRPCHDDVHADPRRSRADGWLVSLHSSPVDMAAKYRGRWCLLDPDGGVVPLHAHRPSFGDQVDHELAEQEGAA